MFKISTSRKKVGKLLVFILLAVGVGLYALFSNNSGSAPIKPSGGGKLVDIGQFLSILFDHQWEYSTAIFMGVTFIAIGSFIYFTYLFFAKPSGLVIENDSLRINGFPKISCKISDVQKFQYLEKKGQPYLEVTFIDGRNPRLIYLGLTDKTNFDALRNLAKHGVLEDSTK